MASTSRSCTYSISAASSAPPRGARKTAPMPAPIPAHTAMRRSLASSCNRSLTKEPNPAEIWATGPSRPADPPDPMVMTMRSV